MATTPFGLLNSAKLKDPDPETYLRYFLSKVTAHPVKRIDEFLLLNVILE